MPRGVNHDFWVILFLDLKFVVSISIIGQYKESNVVRFSIVYVFYDARGISEGKRREYVIYKANPESFCLSRCNIMG